MIIVLGTLVIRAVVAETVGLIERFETLPFDTVMPCVIVITCRHTVFVEYFLCTRIRHIGIEPLRVLIWLSIPRIVIIQVAQLVQTS